MNRILSSLFLVWVFSSCGGIDFSDENEVRRILHLAELKKGLVPKETEGRIHRFARMMIAPSRDDCGLSRKWKIEVLGAL